MLKINNKLILKDHNLINLGDLVLNCLEIDILNKKPGIFSARWAGKSLNLDVTSGSES